MSDVDVIIVAHEAGDYLRGAVASVASDPDVRRVIIVDNASTDGVPDAVAAAHPNVRLIRAENRGFAAGNNVGIADSDAPWLLLLNPDAEVAAGSLRSLLAFANEHPKVAIVGPEILNPDGSRQAGSRGRFPALVSVISLHMSRVRASLRRATPPVPERLPAPARMDWITGAAMLVRRASIDAVGPMDEEFFLYYEDVDWCHRMSDAGWEVWVEPAATAIHHLGKSTVPSAFSAEKYRAAFYRYCDKYGLWGLKLAARLGIAARRSAGGSA